SLADLVLENRIGLAERLQALERGLAADDPDGETRAREGLAPNQPLRHAQLGADGAYLVLEQRPQRLDQLELQVVGQATDVVVGLDRRRSGPASGLNHVG